MAIASPRSGLLPVPATVLIGREEDIETTKRLLGSHRLVTLTGAGGSGKTRLAIAVAAEAEDDYRDGTTFVVLQDTRDRVAVAAAIATSLGIGEHVDVDLEKSIATHLAEREALLVLDNFEQVLTEAPLISELLEAAPSMRIIVTSRAPLRVAGEQELEVLPLDDDAAVALFVERARAVRPNFDTEEHEATIAGIISRVDGLPLAVELAAAQIRLLTPQAILERLEARLPVLSGGQRDAPARQRTQRATLDWSYELLDEPTRRLFATLSVFAGGWTMDAAGRVGEATGGRGFDVFGGLAALVEHSLVRVDETAGTEPRYGMLQLTREYATELLADTGERSEIGRLHAEWVCDLVETAEPELVLRDLRSWQERLSREEDNIRVALTWAIDHREAELGQRIAGSLWRFWHYWGEFREGISWLESVLDMSDTKTPSEPLARTMSALAAILWHQGHGADSLALYLDVIELHRALGDDAHLREAIDDASWAAMLSGDSDLAMQLTEEKWRYPIRPGSPGIESWKERRTEAAVRDYAWRGKGSYEDIIAAVEATLDDVRRSEQALFAAYMTTNVASMYFKGGHADLALQRGREALRLYAHLGHVGQLAVTLGLLSACELALGRPERAVRLGAASERRSDEFGGTVGSYGGPLAQNRDYIAGARSQLPADRYARAVAEGRGMSLEEAVAFALSKASTGRGKGATRGRDPDALTPRELEVLNLLSAGQTDAEIGEALFISPKTASVHVANIKGKLAAGSRAEIVAMALRGDSATSDP